MSNEATSTSMSAYELDRWTELQKYWEDHGDPGSFFSPRVRKALKTTKDRAIKVGAKAGEKASALVPSGVKDGVVSAGTNVAEAIPNNLIEGVQNVADSGIELALDSATKLINLICDWSIELSNPETVLKYHQKLERDIVEISDLWFLDLEDLDVLTRRLGLKWRSIGALEGAGVGALSMIPIPGVGSLAGIAVDVVAMQVLSTAVATHICYSYGFDPKHPDTSLMIEKMVKRQYSEQVPKVAVTNRSARAFADTAGRVNWSQKVRENHKLLAALEKLMKQFSLTGKAPISQVRMGLPVVSVVIGAGVNSHLLTKIALDSRAYAATRFLVEKYDLEDPLETKANEDFNDTLAKDL